MAARRTSAGSGPRRRRIVEWADPALVTEAVKAHDGLTLFRKWVAGELPDPPVAALIGMKGRLAEPGRLVVSMVPGEEHYNGIGVVHGGILSILVDHVMACSVATTLPHGSHCTTIEFKINFLRPVTVETGEVIAEGKVLQAGRRVALAEGSLRDGGGRVVCHATSSCLVTRAQEIGARR